MPKVNIPKDAVDKAQSMALKPIGWYPTVISLVEYGDTSKKDKKMYTFHHTVTEGEHAGTKFMKWHVEPFGSLGLLFPHLVPPPPTNPDGSYDVDPSECQGKNIDVHISRGKNDKNGKDTNDLDDYRKYKSGASVGVK